ncbi:Di-copper centre-containing protein [Thozetella sp. PMI_491]|nr:Di-copper centre-containing protein [Thozetella sp. PMI_491]
MHAQILSLVILQAASTVLGGLVPPTPHGPVLDARDGALTDNVDKVAALAAAALNKAKTTADATLGGRCTWKNVKVRKEWGKLTVDERKAYIAAVKCLQSKPALTPSSVASGAKTRFDDFVATHINQTLTIHYTGNFLGWHRYFTYLYEKALSCECGYKGTQPYWDWAQTAITGMTASPIFDGSDTSMSGQGAAIPNQGDIILGASSGLPPIVLDAGPGGGCVTSGPFKDMKVNLGPAALDTPGGISVSNPNGPLTYNPRCLSRSLTDSVNQRFANATSIFRTVSEPGNVFDFQMMMQGVPGFGDIGVHGGGHYALGGDPGRDVFVSPGDPAFYLHHAMIDRTWWMWQMQDPANRVSGPNAVIGTNTFLNSPPSANTTLDDFVDYGFAAGPPRKLRDLMSTMGGPFCYVYE